MFNLLLFPLDQSNINRGMKINKYSKRLMVCVFRQTGMGFVSTMARVGSMAAPAVLILDEVTSLIKMDHNFSRKIIKYLSF